MKEQMNEKVTVVCATDKTEEGLAQIMKLIILEELVDSTINEMILRLDLNLDELDVINIINNKIGNISLKDFLKFLDVKKLNIGIGNSKGTCPVFLDELQSVLEGNSCTNKYHCDEDENDCDDYDESISAKEEFFKMLGSIMADKRQ